MTRWLVFARLSLPLLVAIVLWLGVSHATPSLLLLAVLLFGPIAMFLDHCTTALRTPALFHMETLARVALVCAAAIACQDAVRIDAICLLSLVVLQVVALALLGAVPRRTRTRAQCIFGGALAFESVWFTAHTIGTELALVPLKVPAAPLWLLVLGMCLTLVYARENAWASLTRSRRLSAGQRAVIWPTMVATHTSAQYWTLVFDYFRSVRWAAEKELNEAVAVAPMDYLVDYIKAQFDDDSTRRYVHASLYRAMFESIKERMQAIDYRAGIAWSMASSPKEAISMLERMRDKPESVDSMELPAL